MASFAHGREGEGERSRQKAERHAAGARGVKLRPTELGATELALATLPAELEELAAAVRADGGAVLATLPRAARRPRAAAARAAHRQGRADAVPARRLRRARAPADAGDGQDEALPRSDHRRARADRRRGVLDAERLPPADRAQGAGRARPCSRCWCPSAPVAYQILALNIEKAHNLREKAIEVRRMYVDLAPISDGDEESIRARVRGAGAGRRSASPTRSAAGCRAARTTRSCARSTSGCPGKLAKALSERRERAGAAARPTTRR